MFLLCVDGCTPFPLDVSFAWRYTAMRHLLLKSSSFRQVLHHIRVAYLIASRADPTGCCIRVQRCAAGSGCPLHLVAVTGSCWMLYPAVVELGECLLSFLQTPVFQGIATVVAPTSVSHIRYRPSPWGRGRQPANKHEMHGKTKRGNEEGGNIQIKLIIKAIVK